MGYDADADVNRFVRLGAIAVVVVAAFGWFMHDFAARRMRPASLEPPAPSTWTAGGALGQGSLGPVRR
jgi:hypothetical protein